MSSRLALGILEWRRREATREVDGEVISAGERTFLAKVVRAVRADAGFDFLALALALLWCGCCLRVVVLVCLGLIWIWIFLAVFVLALALALRLAAAPAGEAFFADPGGRLAVAV